MIDNNNQQPEIISKLVAMYKRGATEAERQNAYDKLERFCKKYNITIEQALDETLEHLEDRFVKVEGEWGSQLAVQIDAFIRGINSKVTSWDERKKIIRLKQCSAADWITFQEFYFHYANQYRKGLNDMKKAFFSAFISKNNLFNSATKEELEARKLHQNASDTRVTTDKINTDVDIKMAMSMFEHIERTTPMKQLETSKK